MYNFISAPKNGTPKLAKRKNAIKDVGTEGLRRATGLSCQTKFRVRYPVFFPPAQSDRPGRWGLWPDFGIRGIRVKKAPIHKKAPP